MIKLISIDLDGTLLNSAKQIDNITKKCLEKVKNRGIQVVLTSGRHFPEILPYLTRTSHQKDKYVIASDGQYLYSTMGQILWQSEFLHCEDVKLVFELLNKKQVLAVLDDKNVFICENDFRYYIEKIKSLVCTREFVYKMSDFSFLGSMNIEKLMFFNQLLNEEERNLIKRYYTFHYLQEKRKGFELLNRNVSKYNALVALSKIENIKLDEILFIGNDSNDLECFRNLKYTVAMGNSEMYIKKIARWITETNDNNGVSAAINSILELEL